MMRMILGAALFLLMAEGAKATTVVIMTDPMTLERRTMVIDDKGPNRILLCSLPPAVSGCRKITPRRP